MIEQNFLQEMEIAALPRLVFGPGKLQKLPGLISDYGQRCLLLTGGHSFLQSEFWPRLQNQLHEHHIEYWHLQVEGEPSPMLVDEAVQNFKDDDIQVVVAIGGGSVLDAAKAIAGLLPFGNSVLDHLEGVGRGIEYSGPALPYIAVPTTAGTGSEATKNAVLSVQAADGYKKSFRHDTLMARVAILDPYLLRSCPPNLIAGQGMDTFTQLLESYVSIKANAFSDALAFSGLQAFHQGFWSAWHGGNSAEAEQGRAAMLYAAYLSGVTLAHVGLGSVHGLASPLGAFYPIPHGVVCGTLVAAATEINITALRSRLPESVALGKYADIGRLLSGETGSDQAMADRLLELLGQWTERLQLPLLHEYGVVEADMAKIVANSRGNSMQTNPLKLTDTEIEEIVRRRL